jgi:predicted nucleic acid-binding protein
MKILLDTSFLLPFINVEPDNIPPKRLKEILEKKNNHYYYCELSIFELVAKGMKICLDSELTIDEIHKGIDSLVYRSPIKSISWISHPELLETAYEIRKFHSDTLDCLIFSTALYYSDCFSTADDTLILKIKEEEQLVKSIVKINPNFYVWFDDLEHPPVLFSELSK